MVTKQTTFLISFKPLSWSGKTDLTNELIYIATYYALAQILEGKQIIEDKKL